MAMPKLRGYPRRIRFILLYGFCSLPFEMSRVKARLIRGLGGQVGRGVRFGSKSHILCKNYGSVRIDDYARIYPNVSISCDHIELGEDARIDSEVKVRGRGSLIVGRGCYIGARAYIDVSRDVTIEDDAGIGPGTWIFTHSVWHPVTEGGPRKFAPIRIEKGAWIPAGVFIIPGITVGHHSTVGARSLLVEDVAPFTFVAGSPAKFVRSLPPPGDAPSRATAELALDIAKDFADFAVAVGLATDSMIQTTGQIVFLSLRGRNPKDDPYVVEWWFGVPMENGPTSPTLPVVLARDRSVVSLHALSAHLIAQLSQVNVSWFDLARHLRSERNTPVDEELHNFLRGEYGIRTYRARAP